MTGKVIIACWIAFYAYWLLTAHDVKPPSVRQALARELIHRIPVLAAATILIMQVGVLGLGVRWLPPTPAVAAVGIAVTLLGLAAAVWARRTIGTNWSSAVMLKQGHELVQHGPYRWVRNPIYSSLLLMLLGTAIAVGRVRGVVALALALAGFWIKLRQEEALMLRQFPSEYADYRRRVKALIPFLL